jgi:hypothetical protein
MQSVLLDSLLREITFLHIGKEKQPGKYKKGGVGDFLALIGFCQDKNWITKTEAKLIISFNQVRNNTVHQYINKAVKGIPFQGAVGVLEFDPKDQNFDKTKISEFMNSLSTEVGQEIDSSEDRDVAEFIKQEIEERTYLKSFNSIDRLVRRVWERNIRGKKHKLVMIFPPKT